MGTPLPFEEDRQEGEVDVHDAVGEPELGCQLHTALPLRLFTRNRYWALTTMGHTLLLQRVSVQ